MIELLIIILALFTFHQVYKALEFSLTEDVDILISNNTFIFAISFLTIYCVSSLLKEAGFGGKD